MLNSNFEFFSNLLNPLGIEIENLSLHDMPDVEMYKIKVFGEGKINRNHWDSRNGCEIKYLVTHYTVCNFLATMRIFTQDIPEGRVSAHYVITQREPDINIPPGVIFQLVDEADRAWHAGLSQWGNQANLNAPSIGIELVNQGFVGNYTSLDCKWFQFDEEQVRVACLLQKNIVSRYSILPQNIVGHTDIAPDRKQDPGILFPWGTIYKSQNIGMWLTDEESTNTAEIVQKYSPLENLPQGVSVPFVYAQLQKIGYPFKGVAGYSDPGNKPVFIAFRMHHVDNQHPENNLSRDIDQRDSLYGWGLVAKYKQFLVP